MLSDDDKALMRAVATYLRHVNAAAADDAASGRTPVGDLISEHLGVPAETLPVVQETLADHRLVDADIALELMSSRVGGRVVGVSGGDQRHHNGLAELVSSAWVRFAAGPVDYSERATGPATTRRVVSFGLHLLQHDGAPIAVLQRSASERAGRPSALLEVMGPDTDSVAAFLEELRRLMLEHSTLRGRLLSFAPTVYGQSAGTTFLARPEVSAEDVILPDGVLEEVTRHVIGVGLHSDLLRAKGQHLKRGVLLYGPPGTGKTLTVRHLLSRTEGVTAVVLTGAAIAFIAQAAEVARTFAPSIVVLEDIDLVAMERHASPQPLLFQVLDALDGLDGDADVAFVMTTNRVDVLERALAERPGRVDLAMEVPLPGREERLRLFRHYARLLPFSDEALERAAARADGTTGSFAKELVRRSLLLAATAGRAEADDSDLEAALDDLLDASRRLTRQLLGGASDPAQ